MTPALVPGHFPACTNYAENNYVKGKVALDNFLPKWHLELIIQIKNSHPQAINKQKLGL